MRRMSPAGFPRKQQDRRTRHGGPRGVLRHQGQPGGRFASRPKVGCPTFRPCPTYEQLYGERLLDPHHASLTTRSFRSKIPGWFLVRGYRAGMPPPHRGLIPESYLSPIRGTEDKTDFFVCPHQQLCRIHLECRPISVAHNLHFIHPFDVRLVPPRSSDHKGGR